MDVDEKHMHRCIELAEKGIGNVSPNPMVGAVITHNNTIIGEGYHQEFGNKHAEVNAINQVKDKSKLKDSVLYVSLEPCAHQGKTPPCTELIIKYKIPNVFIGSSDPFRKVNGQGIEFLKNSGVNVKFGILENKCKELNKRFFTFHLKKRPYIILKWAQSLDGYIDKERPDNSKGVNWITSDITQSLTHKWRAEEDAILVGKKTIITDNPSLTARAFYGKNPERYIIDPNLELTKDYHIFNDTFKTFIINTKKSGAEGTTHYIQFKKGFILKDLLNFLHKKEIQSIIIEGGKNTLNHFIKSQIWDEARVLTGEVFFEKGLSSPSLGMSPIHSFNYDKDRIDIYRK